MGASVSYSDNIPVIEHFENLIKYINEINLSNEQIKKLLETLTEETQNFSMSFDSCVRKGKFNRDISPYFEKIEKAINSFIKCAQYIFDNQELPETRTFKLLFQKDISSFIQQIINLERFLLIITEILESQFLLNLSEQFYTELSIFDYALTVESLEVPPYYQMSVLPVYSLHNKILRTTQKCLNIVGPHKTGKTTIIPMILACKLLSQSQKNKSKFIVVVENDSTLIHGIEECYNLIKKNKTIPFKEDEDCPFFCEGDADEEEDNEEDQLLLITSSYQKVLEFAKTRSTMVPVITILSPLEVLKLVRNVEGFGDRAIFIIDDAYQRSIETDVLVQDISRKLNSYEKPNKNGKIVLMSHVYVNNLLRFLGRHENFECTLKLEDTAIQKVIECDNIEQICKSKLLKEMFNFFDNLISDTYDIGSTIVFVPNANSGKKTLKKLYQHYSNENSFNVVVLKTKIRKGEIVEEFNKRLMTEIELAVAERAESLDAAAAADSDDILFLLPIDMTGIVIEEEKKFIESKLPLPFIKRKLIRLIISTNKNESFISPPDLTAIFDSGLTDTEYYNIEKGVSCYKEEMLPKAFIEQRYQLLSNCKKGVHFIFNIKSKERPENILAPVKRCNMVQSILRLREIGIKLEKEMNLPEEPNRNLLDASVNLLKKIGIIDSDSNELTEIGKTASKFSSVHPFFALATAKFAENHEFAFLVSLIIERFDELIENSQSQLLYDNFCSESDIVTVIESILALNTNGDLILEEKDVKLDESGFSIGTLYSIYTSLANTFEKNEIEEGRIAVIDAIKWAKKQPGGVLLMVDKYVSLLDQNNFIDLRKGTFECIIGAGPGCETTLVYKTNDIFKFDKDKDAHVKFSQRPGWLGLQSPGNIIVLSLQVEESAHFNRGLIIHRDPSNIGVNPGVVSQLELNPSLNSYFFTALFEAYWSGQPTVNNFIGIYHSNKPKKEAAFLINICESNNKTYLNYCPRNSTVKDDMNAAIPLLASLLPYVPRSIVVKSEVPLCAVEVVTYGTSSNYESNLYLVTDPTKKSPFAYPINKALLEYARSKIKDLQAAHPLLRFAITGESVYYKFNNEKQQETDFAFPVADPNIKSVFNPSHSSQLVFLVDFDYPDKPAGIAPIQWLAADDAGVGSVQSNDTKEIELLTNSTSKILNGLGRAERSEDLFYITLDGGFPSAKEEEIPESIREKVGYRKDEQGAIKNGVDQLVRQFTRNLSQDFNLIDQITINQLGSTNHCSKYQTEEAQRNVLNQINTSIIDKFHIPIDSIQSCFLGPSMICLSITNLPPNLTTHPKHKDIFDDSYLPCQADQAIEETLRSISIPVTAINHEPTVNVTIYHYPRIRLNHKAFEERVDSIAKEFGFLCSSKSNYLFYDDDNEHGIIGDVSISLIGKNTCIAFANRVSTEFPVVLFEAEDNRLSKTFTMTMATETIMRTFRDLDPRLKSPPKLNPVEMAMHIPENEIESIKDLIKYNKELKFDEKYRVLIFPSDKKEEITKKMGQMREEKLEVACFLGCGLDEPDLLPECIYANEKDGTVKPFGICKGCMMSIFQYDVSIQSIFNPVTHLIDHNNLSKIPERLKGFALVEESKEDDGNYWPIVPFGQLIWALMSDLNDELPPYIKAWFTIIVEYTIQNSGNFIFCPNHPNKPILYEPGKKIKCPFCDMMFCDVCMIWHDMSVPCEKDDPSIKRCPWCRMPGVKVSGCNRITCPKCDKCWCYECLAAFHTAAECYAHMGAVGH